MTYYSQLRAALVGVAVATLFCACATAPQQSSSAAPSSSPTPPAVAARDLDCRQLSAEIAAARETQRAALEKEENAWKAVVPVAVVARYAQGRKTAADAQQRISDLQAAAQRKACLTPW